MNIKTICVLKEGSSDQKFYLKDNYALQHFIILLSSHVKSLFLHSLFLDIFLMLKSKIFAISLYVIKRWIISLSLLMIAYFIAIFS